MEWNISSSDGAVYRWISRDSHFLFLCEIVATFQQPPCSLVKACANVCLIYTFWLHQGALVSYQKETIAVRLALTFWNRPSIRESTSQRPVGPEQW